MMQRLTKEQAAIIEDQSKCVVDLTKTDTYPDGLVPDHDVEVCLRVLRTLHKGTLGLVTTEVQSLIARFVRVFQVKEEVSDAATVVDTGTDDS